MGSSTRLRANRICRKSGALLSALAALLTPALASASATGGSTLITQAASNLAGEVTGFCEIAMVPAFGLAGLAVMFGRRQEALSEHGVKLLLGACFIVGGVGLLSFAVPGVGGVAL